MLVKTLLPFLTTFLFSLSYLFPLCALYFLSWPFSYALLSHFCLLTGEIRRVRCPPLCLSVSLPWETISLKFSLCHGSTSDVMFSFLISSLFLSVPSLSEQIFLLEMTSHECVLKRCCCVEVCVCKSTLTHCKTCREASSPACFTSSHNCKYWTILLFRLCKLLKNRQNHIGSHRSDSLSIVSHNSYLHQIRTLRAFEQSMQGNPTCTFKHVYFHCCDLFQVSGEQPQLKVIFASACQLHIYTKCIEWPLLPRSVTSFLIYSTSLLQRLSANKCCQNC